MPGFQSPLGRILVLGLLLLAGRPLAAADNELTPEEEKQGWRLLFNGRDHSGWICNTGKPIATPVEDGCLLPYKSGGYIIMYDEKFADFVLQADVKLSEPECNSGIFFRVGNARNPVYSGFEVQLFAGTGTSMHDFGAIYDLVAPSKNLSKPSGEWNHVVLTCRGPKISVEVNGEVVAEMNCDEWPERGKRPDGSRHKFGAAIAQLPREGYLGFQDHGAPCWFKNVKLLVLEPESDSTASREPATP